MVASDLAIRFYFKPSVEISGFLVSHVIVITTFGGSIGFSPRYSSFGTFPIKISSKILFALGAPLRYADMLSTVEVAILAIAVTRRGLKLNTNGSIIEYANKIAPVKFSIPQGMLLSVKYLLRFR